jgi:surface protein
MFGWMEGLQSIDLSVFDTKNVETMNQMFSFCESMTSFDFSTFNTSNLIDVS